VSRGGAFPVYLFTVLHCYVLGIQVHPCTRVLPIRGGRGGFQGTVKDGLGERGTAWDRETNYREPVRRGNTLETPCGMSNVLKEARANQRRAKFCTIFRHTLTPPIRVILASWPNRIV
jgi:hypothetical protein